jgi:hypothetical protein
MRTIVGRQGDVVVERVSAIPKNAKKLDGKKVQFNSEFGPGHSHQMNVDEMFAVAGENGTTYVLVNEPTQMTHPEHPTLDVAAGIYAVRTVRDFAPRRNMLD